MGTQARTRYFDRSVGEVVRYLYRITAVSKHGESGGSRSAKANIYPVVIMPFPGSFDAPLEE